jgi:septum formation protein
MINNSQKIYLASSSPRRKKLLEQIGLKFEVVKVNTPERIKKNETPIKIVKRISLEKLDAAKKKINSGIIITADTIVVLNSKILGKPNNKKDAFRILNLLSGNTHFVYTGFSIFNSQNLRTISEYEKTSVKFRKLSKSEIQEYIESGSPMDKAGAYGIQDDFGAVFVQKINGCYYNVVGLPLSKFYNSLNRII